MAPPADLEESASHHLMEQVPSKGAILGVILGHVTMEPLEPRRVPWLEESASHHFTKTCRAPSGRERAVRSTLLQVSQRIHVVDDDKHVKNHDS